MGGTEDHGGCPRGFRGCWAITELGRGDRSQLTEIPQLRKYLQQCQERIFPLTQGNLCKFALKNMEHFALKNMEHLVILFNDEK